jgi:peptidoglycan/xylan/chitin deacetylase (PgdA/CDA1 family)
VILLYHGIVGDGAPSERSCAAQALPLSVFVRHIAWIARRRRIVPLSEYLERGHARGAARVAALTFDDGLAETFERVEPYLRSEAIPATFFVSTAHARPGVLLWFTALDALCFEGEHSAVEAGGRVFSLESLSRKRETRRALGAMARTSGDAPAFARELLARHPLSPGARAPYGGMTFEAMRGAASGSLFEIGSHTVTHPYLTHSPLSARRAEIEESRREIEEAVGRRVRYFAYPGGDYDTATLALVRNAGYEAALATVSKRLDADARYEIERVGIYSPPLWKVALKAAGVVPVARRLGFQVG